MSNTEPMPRPRAESRDAEVRLVAAIAGALALIVGLGLVGGYLAIAPSTSRAQATLRGKEELFQNGVAARTDVDLSWDDISRARSLGANEYAWVDRRAGIVQVPIDRAIDLICAQQSGPEAGRMTDDTSR